MELTLGIVDRTFGNERAGNVLSVGAAEYRFYGASSGATDADKRQDAINSIRFYYAHVFNGVRSLSLSHNTPTPSMHRLSQMDPRDTLQRLKSCQLLD